MGRRNEVEVVVKARDEATSKLRSMAGTVGSIFAGIQIGDFLRDSVDLWAKQEAAVKKLDAALSRHGVDVKVVSAAQQRFAAAMQDSIGVGDELILETQALLANYGVMPDSLSKATQATYDFAAATGKSANEAAMQLAKTLGGYAGELGEVIPEVKELTKEELQAGKAIDLIAEKYKGMAEDSLGPTEKMIRDVSNAWGDFSENIGKAVTEIGPLKAALDGLTQALKGEALSDLLLGTNKEQALEKQKRQNELAADYLKQIKALEHEIRIASSQEEELLKKRERLAEVGQDLHAGDMAMLNALGDSITRKTEKISILQGKAEAASRAASGMFQNVKKADVPATAPGAKGEGGKGKSRKTVVEEVKEEEIDYLAVIHEQIAAQEELNRTYAERAVAASNATAAGVAAADQEMARIQQEIWDEAARETEKAARERMRRVLDASREEQQAALDRAQSEEMAAIAGIAAGEAFISGLAQGMENKDPKVVFGSVLQLAVGLIGAFGGGGVGAAAAMAGLNLIGGAFRHTGSSVFETAHTGAGLRSDETLRTLKDEMVLNRQAVDALGGRRRVMAAQAGIPSGGGGDVYISAIDTQGIRDSVRRGALDQELALARKHRRGRFGRSR